MSLQTWEGTPINESIFRDHTPAELVELGIAHIKHTSLEYLEQRLITEGAKCPNPFCDATERYSYNHTEWSVCLTCSMLWTIHAELGLIWVGIEQAVRR